jgi:hypothetical protein
MPVTMHRTCANCFIQGRINHSLQSQLQFQIRFSHQDDSKVLHVTYDVSVLGGISGICPAHMPESVPSTCQGQCTFSQGLRLRKINPPCLECIESIDPLNMDSELGNDPPTHTVTVMVTEHANQLLSSYCAELRAQTSHFGPKREHYCSCTEQPQPAQAPLALH